MTANRSVGFRGHQEYAEESLIPFRHLQPIATGVAGIVDEVVGTAGEFEGRTYARKTIMLHGTKSQKDQLASIENEVRILRKLRHCHVVQLVTTYSFKNTYAVIMNQRADHTLEELLQNMDNSTTWSHEVQMGNPRWFRCLINGIAYMHDQGIRHRDIKPHNILVKDGNVLFTDFGRWSIAPLMSKGAADVAGQRTFSL
ncbi:kinase-like domain-containing protein [Aspergillus navahoensis]